MAGGERQVVVALDAARRRVVVGPRRRRHAAGAAARGELAGTAPAAALRCTVKLRAREAPQRGRGRADAEGAEVRLDAPALPAPGQACVFYDGSRVLGGGFITPPAGD